MDPKYDPCDGNLLVFSEAIAQACSLVVKQGGSRWETAGIP